jgi:DICT domain-containing protein
MALDDVIASVERSERTLTVFNPEGAAGGDEPADGSPLERAGVVEELAAILADRNVTVRRKTTTSGRPENVAVLEMDGVVLSTVDVDSLRSMLEGADSSTGGLGSDTEAYADVLRHLQETTFTSYERERMLEATREIEDRAFRVGNGRLDAGFQTVDRLRYQREEYEELARRDLEVTVYATPGEEDLTLHGVEVRTPEAAEIATHWFVAFDGGGEPSQKCALLAEERADGFYGFWTYDPDVVDWILTHLEERYG